MLERQRNRSFDFERSGIKLDSGDFSGCLEIVTEVRLHVQGDFPAQILIFP
jgi:hypothetical protein